MCDLVEAWAEALYIADRYVLGVVVVDSDCAGREEMQIYPALLRVASACGNAGYESHEEKY